MGIQFYDLKRKLVLLLSCSVQLKLHHLQLLIIHYFCLDNVLNKFYPFQLELLGQSIYDYVHPCDQEELKENLNGKHNGVQVEFFLRLKYAGSCKGRIVHVKSASFMVVISNAVLPLLFSVF